MRAGKAAPERAGDVWTWTALDCDSKLIILYLIGGRDAEYATAFMADLRDRIEGRVQITTDKHAPYRWAVDDAFGSTADYAQLVKHYAPEQKGERRYSPPKCVGAEKRVMEGNPDLSKVSTSYVERSNLSMRMHMRRYTRLTNAHSKKFANHCHMVSLYTVWYNFVRTNRAVRMPPAMAAGIMDSPMEMADIVKLIDANAPKLGPRGPYKKNNSK